VSAVSHSTVCCIFIVRAELPLAGRPCAKSGLRTYNVQFNGLQATPFAVLLLLTGDTACGVLSSTDENTFDLNGVISAI
jgi:hypothetical protein